MYFTGELRKRASCALCQEYTSIHLTQQCLHQLIYNWSLKKLKYSLLSKLLIQAKYSASNLLRVSIIFPNQAYGHDAPEPPHNAIIRPIQ